MSGRSVEIRPGLFIFGDSLLYAWSCIKILGTRLRRVEALAAAALRMAYLLLIARAVSLTGALVKRSVSCETVCSISFSDLDFELERELELLDDPIIIS